ncbi:hypothetical protein DIPPA_12417 [Diplonema papillatum]|nr:hypothetical protein DIPPA_12417 [Diplonema papillatum]
MSNRGVGAAGVDGFGRPGAGKSLSRLNQDADILARAISWRATQFLRYAAHTIDFTPGRSGSLGCPIYYVTTVLASLATTLSTPVAWNFDAKKKGRRKRPLRVPERDGQPQLARLESEAAQCHNPVRSALWLTVSTSLCSAQAPSPKVRHALMLSLGNR